MIIVIHNCFCIPLIENPLYVQNVLFCKSTELQCLIKVLFSNYFLFYFWIYPIFFARNCFTLLKPVAVQIPNTTNVTKRILFPRICPLTSIYTLSSLPSRNFLISLKNEQ